MLSSSWSFPPAFGPRYPQRSGTVSTARPPQIRTSLFVCVCDHRRKPYLCLSFLLWFLCSFPSFSFTYPVSPFTVCNTNPRCLGTKRWARSCGRGAVGLKSYLPTCAATFSPHPLRGSAPAKTFHSRALAATSAMRSIMVMSRPVKGRTLLAPITMNDSSPSGCRRMSVELLLSRNAVAFLPQADLAIPAARWLAC